MSLSAKNRTGKPGLCFLVSVRITTPVAGSALPSHLQIPCSSRGKESATRDGDCTITVFRVPVMLTGVHCCDSVLTLPATGLYCCPPGTQPGGRATLPCSQGTRLKQSKANRGLRTAIDAGCDGSCLVVLALARQRQEDC